ncbi:MAG TPA: L,D-transpeptidase family protein [Terriglobales bacterium]|nr:L,D-transpeptidase family protein [Terriglobales bacterium]
MRILLILRGPLSQAVFILLFAITVSAVPQENDKSIQRALQSAKKLIVVTAPDWDSAQGTLTRYERHGCNWVKAGDSIPVVVGRAGLAWDPALTREAPDRYPGPVKHEGDGRSPAGVFPLNRGTFGFADELPGSRHYLHLTSAVECVDDPDSRYYAKVVDRSKVDQVDWKSSEKMSSIPQYRWGVIVNYNMDHPTRGDGSCIFLHQWSSPTSGTAGCTAMAPQNIEQVVRWVSEEGSSILVQLPKSEYERLRVLWELP